jgi:hypothetical protein
VLPRAAARASTPGLSLPARPASGRIANSRRPGSGDAPAGGGVTADELVRRLSSSSSPASGAGTVRRSPDGAARHARPAGAHRPPTAPPAATTIRRSVADAPLPAATAGAAGATDTVRRLLSTDGSSTDTATSGNGTQNGQHGTESTDMRSRGWPLMTNGLDSSTLRDLADWIVEQVEERVVRELERRGGGRYRGEL